MSDTKAEANDDVRERSGAAAARGARPRAWLSTAVRLARAFGEWLGALSWRRFIGLSLLVMIAAAVTNSIVSTDARRPAVIITNDDTDNVEVAVSPRGIVIGPAHKKKEAQDDAAGAANPAPAPSGPDEAEAPPASAGDSDLSLPLEELGDPQRRAKAIDEVRRQVERMVRERVARDLQRAEVRQAKERSDWVVTIAVLAILSLVIVKVVLGSMRRAEDRARVATAAASEEGLKRQLVEANLKMMQAQVEPHFLFNTLASVDYLIETDPARASKMQKNLIQYLRAALPQMREGSTTLGREMVLCRSYLEILKVRMEDRLQFAINVPQGLLSAQFPPMMLPTLVENAVKHGLEPKPEGGSLTIAADIANGQLRVTVADTGLGFGAASQPGTGLGLANVRERLAALYHGAAKLAVEANSPAGTIVRIELPYTFDPAARDDVAPAAPQPV